MAIVQVGGTTWTERSSGSTSLTINKPTSMSVGDVMIAMITCDGTSPSAPSGWTEFGGGLHGSASWNNRLYYRVVTGSEGSSFTWTTGSSGPAAGLINAWTGVNTSGGPIDGFVETEGTTSSEANTGPTATISVTGGHRMMYVRAVRDAPGNGTATKADLTEASATASVRRCVGSASATGNTSYTIAHFNEDADDAGSGSYPGLAITCDISEDHNYEATFALKGLGVPADGSITSTTPSVTSSFAGTRTMADGPIASTVPSVSASWIGIAAPPEGPMAATTPSVTSALAGAHDHAGPVGATTPLVSTAFVGAVNPSGSISATLPGLSVALGSETKPFGEHVILVEAEHRAFRVIDDDPGLAPITRSQVTDA